MPYTKFRNGFEIQTASAVDKRIYLTKAEMLRESSEETSLYVIPDVYLAICPDDGRLYLYNINNEPNAITGKFKPVEATLVFDTAESKAAFENAIAESEKIINLEDKVGDAEHGLIKDVSDVKEEIQDIQGDVTVLKTEVTTLQEEVEGDDGLLARVMMAESKLNDLEPRLIQAEVDLSDLETRFAALKIDDLSGQLDGGKVM